MNVASAVLVNSVLYQRRIMGVGTTAISRYARFSRVLSTLTMMSDTVGVRLRSCGHTLNAQPVLSGGKRVLVYRLYVSACIPSTAALPTVRSEASAIRRYRSIKHCDRYLVSSWVLAALRLKVAFHGVCGEEAMPWYSMAYN